jgi:hypothetical protein
MVDFGDKVPESANITFEQGHVLKQEKIYKENYQPFSMIGAIRSKKGANTTEPDIFDTLSSLSGKALELFVELKSNMDTDNNLCHYPTDTWSQSEKVLFRKRRRELIKAEILKIAKNNDEVRKINPHIPKQTYMINPYLLKPRKYSHAQEIWRYL